VLNNGLKVIEQVNKALHCRRILSRSEQYLKSRSSLFGRPSMYSAEALTDGPILTLPPTLYMHPASTLVRHSFSSGPLESLVGLADCVKRKHVVSLTDWYR
jgi:hypothetical protein